MRKIAVSYTHLDVDKRQGQEHVDGRNDTTVNISVDTIEEAERVFAALSAGGEIRMPLMETDWSLRFAMFEDRYGKPWICLLYTSRCV